MPHLLNKMLFFYQISTITLQQICQVGGTEELFLFEISMAPFNATQGNSDIQIPKKYQEYVDILDKVKASVLTKHWPHNYHIELELGK